MLLSKATNIAFKLQFYILSALAFPGNRTHDLGVASAMLYHLSYRKAITLSKVLNMDIFLTQTHRFTSEGIYLPPRAVWSTFFMMDGCTFFWASKSQPPFTAIIKLGRTSTIFYITLIVFIWNKKVSPRMAWGWVNHGVIFIFGWTIPLRTEKVS